MKNIILFIVLVVIALAGMLLAQQQSHIDLTFGEWTVSIKTWLVVLGLITLIVAYKIVVGALVWLITIPQRLSTYRKESSAEKEKAQEQAYQEKITGLRNAKDINSLNEQWNMLSSNLQKQPEFALVYAQKALQYGNETAAASVIEWQIAKGWDSSFVTLYGLLRQNVAARLRELEYWLKQHPSDQALLLALGRLSIAADDWGKAEQYLQQSIAQQPSVPAYLELAQVQQQLGKTESSLRSYQSARNLARTQV